MKTVTFAVGVAMATVAILAAWCVAECPFLVLKALFTLEAIVAGGIAVLAFRDVR